MADGHWKVAPKVLAIRKMRLRWQNRGVRAEDLSAEASIANEATSANGLAPGAGKAAEGDDLAFTPPAALEKVEEDEEDEDNIGVCGDGMGAEGARGRRSRC